MNFLITRQDSYSRGNLLLRLFFGVFYIGIPHGFVLWFYSIGLMFLRIYLFWVILFTGNFPKFIFDYQLNLMRYKLRVNAVFFNLRDGYPEFGLNHNDENIVFDLEYKENISRLRLLGRTLFGGLLIFPHVFVLVFRIYATMFIKLVSFWVILFTGKYPEGMFNFVEGLFRWLARITAYLSFYTDDYPAFTGKVLPGENEDLESSTANDYNSELLDA